MATCLPLSLLLLVTAALAAHMSQEATAVRTTAHLRVDMRDLCAQFLTVSDFVVSNCSAPAYENLQSDCLESFQLFDETPALLLACEKHERHREAKARMVQFLEVYNKWQRRHTCDLFHAKEERAARYCGGAAVQRPWHKEAYPLYCDEIFAVYKSHRGDLDAMCARTAFSDAFWEAFADYVASPVCKQYYKHVRGATAHGCAHATHRDNSTACQDMFLWYTKHCATVERECLEVQGAKPFYKGFYAWKRHHHK